MAAMAGPAIGGAAAGAGALATQTPDVGGAEQAYVLPASPLAGVPSGGGFTCGSKRYCSQMNSCEEATFYYRQCGLSRLDGDSDGTPCESLCG
jgi:hypothetical protein